MEEEKTYKAVRVETEAHKQVHLKAVLWGKRVQQVWIALAWSVVGMKKEDLFPEDDNCSKK